MDMQVIRVVDLETTGFKPPEVPIELGWCDILCDGEQPLSIGDWVSLYVDPAGHPISAQSKAVHHIIEEDLVGAMSWPAAVAAMTESSGDFPIIAYAAHNCAFERLWLTENLIGTAWICTFKCAKRLIKDAPSFSNQALRYHLNLPVNRLIADQSHRAGPDAYVTAHLLSLLLQMASVEQLAQWTIEPILLTGKLGFSKHAEKDWSEVEVGFLKWMLEPGRNFDEDKTFTAQYWINEHARASQRAALAQRGAI